MFSALPIIQRNMLPTSQRGIKRVIITAISLLRKPGTA